MGIAERKLKEKQARIRQIKKSAASLFQKKGFEETRMDEIAKRAEISKATIYLYFKSKEDLFYELVQEQLTNLSQNLIEIYNKEKNQENAIRAIMESTYSFYTDAPEVYHMITQFKARELAKVLSADKIKHLKESMRSNLKYLAMTITDGVEQGKFASVDPTLTAVLFWNMFMGIVQFQENRLDVGKKDYRKVTVDAGIEFLLRAMKKA
ncbi:MAG: TetR/AcrR family transcriptional regulator [Syntrophaceae bacterium]